MTESIFMNKKCTCLLPLVKATGTDYKKMAEFYVLNRVSAPASFRRKAYVIFAAIGSSSFHGTQSYPQ